MHGQSCGDDIEARVWEGYPLGDRFDKVGITNARLSREASRRGQHRCDRVGQNDARHVRRERERGVAGARSDIEDPFVSDGRREVDDQLQIAP